MKKLWLVFEEDGGHYPDLLRGIFETEELAQACIDGLPKMNKWGTYPYFYGIVEWEVNKLDGEIPETQPNDPDQRG